MTRLRLGFTPTLFLLALALVSPATAASDESAAVRNWTAPPYWTPPAEATPTQGREALASGRTALGVGPVVMPFVAVAPCRIADTRGFGFTGAYGPPSLAASESRTYTITGQCGIPADAQAVSFNFTVWNTASYGNLTVYPAGGAVPTVSTLNWPPGTLALANAAVVRLGSGGSAGQITVANQSDNTIDVFFDVNGYYSPLGVVNNVNGLTGAVSLTQGSNVTITPSGNTLTIAATGGPGGVLPSGTANQTLRNTGSAWVSSSALTNDGTNVALTGILALPNPARITSGGSNFASTAGPGNTFVGINAGASNAGQNNTGIGFQAMWYGSGVNNLNTALGMYAYNNGPSGNINTAIGAQSLQNCSAGDGNTAIGDTALFALTSGSWNTALGWAAGSSLTGGSSNLYLAHFGVATESNTTRIGTAQTKAFIAGVRGVTTGSATGIAVLIDANGQLGTVSSSASVKHDIRDMGDLSARLMQLRPVAFRYNAQGEDAPVQFGLVAEEVNEVLPELVARNKAGEIETVMYHELPAMLLNELQKALRRIESLESEVAALRGVRPSAR